MQHVSKQPGQIDFGFDCVLPIYITRLSSKKKKSLTSVSLSIFGRLTFDKILEIESP